jgi:flagellar biosynthesis chaperone FliJ
MSNPMLHAFFIGRALAETAGAQVERLMTEALSSLGKFDAEQRENLRQFTEEVLARAQQAEAAAQETVSSPSTGVATGQAQDLQQTIDLLRAEIAQVRVALQQYRASL